MKFYEVLSTSIILINLQYLTISASILRSIIKLKKSLEIAADNYAFLKQNGLLIGDDDILIGSLAIANEAILVTNNIDHLCRLKNIRIENWRE